MSTYGSRALSRLKENEEITVTAQRWEFDIMLRSITERLRDVIRQRNNSVHPVEESQLNQLIDCYEAILTDVGGVLGHVQGSVSLTQEVGFQRIPLTFTEDQLEEARGENGTDVEQGIKEPAYTDDRRSDERRVRTDLTFNGDDRRTGQDRREPASV